MTLLLVVDDEALVLHLVADALEDGGFATFQAISGAEAIAALNDSERQFSGLVTDVNLGDGITGWDLAREARHKNAELPVVYMTADSAHQWSAEGVPNSLLVQKPFAVTQVTTAIAQLMTEAATRHASTGALDPFLPDGKR